MFKREKIKVTLQYELLLLPALIGFVIFFLYPSIQSIFYSFTNYSVNKLDYSFVGLRNYVNVFKDEHVIASIKNTVYFAVCSTLLQNVLAIPLAVALNAKLKTKFLLRMVYFMPWCFSGLIIGFLWSFILSSSDDGLLNHLIHQLGIGFLPNNWLGDPSLAMKSVIFVAVWQTTGWAMIIYLANLQSIPAELYESVKIDGAGKFQAFWHITFKFLAPAMTINVLLSTIGGFKVYDQILALTNGGPGYATESITFSIMNYGFSENKYAYASALSVVMLVVILLISLVQLRFFSKREDNIA
ncbi:carbohydrate ABC transporter permease [Paenibacillus sacheonensis]|uniref:ABC transporter permease subunit n=1 Tax=Paenibacillus sacheonensis TaxID=742054 RepID=A0A7X4YTA2_9BACL|nr:sugar ABC transporter permease [Paenibacillus sacheonensis]MBM7568474.1 raffinose/stachyose/melibiose transport system permease protein [Paenibacillus sacheonensis]NBC72172.1 ABC transporter permease subunit [Paenibacillus sacheonensis]